MELNKLNKDFNASLEEDKLPITKKIKNILKNKNVKNGLKVLGVTAMASLVFLTYNNILEEQKFISQIKTKNQAIYEKIDKKHNINTSFVSNNLATMKTLTEDDLIDIVKNKKDGVYKFNNMDRGILILTNGDGVDKDLLSSYKELENVIMVNEDFKNKKKSSFAGEAYSMSKKEEGIPLLSILNFIPNQMHDMIERSKVDAPVLRNYDEDLSLFVLLHELGHIEKDQALERYNDRLLYNHDNEKRINKNFSQSFKNETHSDVFASLMIGKMKNMSADELSDFIDGIKEIRDHYTEKNTSHATGYGLQVLSKSIRNNPEIILNIKRMTIEQISNLANKIVTPIYNNLNELNLDNKSFVVDNNVILKDLQLFSKEKEVDFEEFVFNENTNSKEIRKSYQSLLKKLSKMPEVKAFISLSNESNTKTLKITNKAFENAIGIFENYVNKINKHEVKKDLLLSDLIKQKDYLNTTELLKQDPIFYSKKESLLVELNKIRESYNLKDLNSINTKTKNKLK